jgi:hydrogenase-4 membrane subunit HyfE
LSKGWLVIANKVTKVLLIGNQYLNGNDRVGFSKYQTKTGNDTTCVPWTQTFEIDIIESSSLLNLTYARTFISMPASYEESWFDIFGSAKIDVYYLCLVSQNTARYPTKLFQGSKLLIFQEPLPTWMKVGFCLIGFLFSFYLSGLVLGIMAIDITDLLLLIKAGTPTQKSNAKHLLPIRKDGNRILSTLLLSNVAANSLVTVFLNNLIDSGFQTFILSTFSLCLIGEIIPQAVFNRHGFILASKSLFFIKFLLFATAPFAVPIGMILDRFLGTEAGMAYTRKQMRQLIELQYENGMFRLLLFFEVIYSDFF